MELLSLLGEENKDVQKAIQYLLDSRLVEADWYKSKQRFTLSPTDIAYCNQREHAIDWFFSKSLWEKKNGKSLQLKRVIEDIQCTPLLVYLAIVTEELEESRAQKIVKKIENELNNTINQYTSKNIRFEEKRMLIESILEEKQEYNLADEIVKKLTSK